MTNQNTVLIGLNEINFSYIESYIEKGYLPNFKELLSEYDLMKTSSEDEYQLLEPWIQWVTLYTGLSYSEHKVFRLGDIVGRNDLTQIFEKLEKDGKKIGTVSPFNAENRLQNAAFFVPDPWTVTKLTGNDTLNSLYIAIRQAVNENAQSKLGLSSVFSLLKGVIKYVPVSRYLDYILLAVNIRKPGVKAIVLDSLLSDVFIKELNKTSPDFSHLFLNAGAHIQHHYLFNSQVYEGDLSNPEWYCPKGYDPLLRVLQEYDKSIGKLLKRKNTKIIVATGLHQQPHKHTTYYWRLNKHDLFLKKIGIDYFKNVIPRMSRDFLIEFDSESKAIKAKLNLDDYCSSEGGEKIFEVDNRGKSLFVELVYSDDIDDMFSIVSSSGGRKIENFKTYISFVAIKNGEHNGIGYLIGDIKSDGGGVIPLKEVRSKLEAIV